jgi:integrase
MPHNRAELAQDAALNQYNLGQYSVVDAGGALNLDNLARRVIIPVVRMSGIEWRGWHAFRRGLATNLHRLGVDDKTIQGILRHSSLATTQEIYIKTVGLDATTAMEKLEAALELKHVN